MIRLFRPLYALPALLLALGVAPAACSSSSTGTTGSGTTSTTTGGTGGGSTGPLLDKDCDPLVPSQCGFPFPSNVYLEADPTTKTGMHVAFRKNTLPLIVGTGHIDPKTWADSDGFSPGARILTDLPGATAQGLPSQDTIDLSLTKDSPTILLDTATGKLVPHFAEIDQSSSAKDGDRAFIINPMVRLSDATRYIVAIRHVVDGSGKEIAPSPAFQALRDGTDSDEASVGARRSLYAEIFDKLDAAGVAKGDLQIAWDFTTASRENNTRWLLHMRDDALATVGKDGPEYTITKVIDDPSPLVRRRIFGMMKVPLYLDKPGPGGKLVFGDDGMPKQNGTAEYEFEVNIPNSLVMSGAAGHPLQNGHGLLGDKTEGEDGYLAQMNDKGYVSIAVDLVGMAEEDYDSVIAAISGDIGVFRQLVDRQHQGILNSLLSMRMMLGRFAKEPQTIFDGKPTIDPTVGYYRGDSQGGIFGTTYMALSTDVTRGLLGEPGMPYCFLLNRSVDFEPFFDQLKVSYKRGREIQIVLGLTQMLWDRTEPSGYAPYITDNMLPGTPKHAVLIHAAVGDYQVTPLGAELIARTVGAKSVKPQIRPIWSVAEQSTPFDGSGIMEFDFGLPESPKTNTPPTGPEDDDPHDKVRVLEASQKQADEFFHSGPIEATCMDTCNPE
ncbi:MAG: hypothetical protein U0359_10920 [Byssovorax sp.]